MSLQVNLEMTKEAKNTFDGLTLDLNLVDIQKEIILRRSMQL